MAAPSKKVLVVDDEPSMREMLSVMLAREGYASSVAAGRAEAVAALSRGTFDLVITDVRLQDGDGIEILREVKESSPDTVVVVMTAFGTTQTAVSAMKLGAHDYVVKPFDIEELKIVIRNAFEKRQLRDENRFLRAEFHSRHVLESIVGGSPAMQKVFSVVRSVAPTASTVLLAGESGTGKELVAKAIHALSPRAEAPFVSVNCGALPETLLESELFGHVKGAFTDAHQTKRGLFEAAHRGTLFLDEVGETSPAMQVKLLRALQERRIRPVGGTDEIEVDVRVVAATNRSLQTLVEERRFREDLYYRLNVIPIHLPPLRERQEDIALLAEHFLRRHASAMGKRVTALGPGVLERMARYHWPGNVRQLENVIERGVALSTGDTLPLQALPEELAVGSDARVPELGPGFSLDAHMLSVEGRLLRAALDSAGGDRTEAARLLGITVRSIRYLVKKHRLQATAS